MKIALMSGAYVNAGDFLIEQRSRELLKTFTGASQIDILKRNISYDDEIDRLNGYDLLVFGGGPGYQRNIYPGRIPFVSQMERITVPIAIMGWGWKGANASPKKIYQYRIDDSTKRFIKYIESAGGLGCRDWYTVYALKNIGFHNIMMTGCPAWYDLDQVEGLHAKKIRKNKIRNICVSDAAFKCNKTDMEDLIIYLRKNFPEAEIQLIFHRGITKNNEMFIAPSFLEHYHLKYKDISGGAEGFSLYNDCDLHVGFRVHAHIYNLSRGNISVLLNEDARGFGVNDALGILNIDLDSSKHLLYRKGVRKKTYKLQNVLEDYLQYIFSSDCLQYEDACLRIQYYFQRMKKYIINFKDFS